MRLLFRATLFYLLITLLVFGAGGIITYNIFVDAIQTETDRYLVERYFDITEKVKQDPFLTNLNDSKIVIRPVNNVPENIEDPKQLFNFSDTMVWHNGLRRMENNRKLTSYIKGGERDFKVEIHDVIVEQDDIYEGVFQSQTRLFIILGVVMVVSSLLISKWMFRPFERTLDRIKNYDIRSLKPTVLGKTGIREFNILNGFVNQMTEKVSRDYRNLKEFTENTAHELQTPLAITQGKLELLLQQEDLTDKQVELIRSSYEAIGHMSKLNKSLTLLSKIENKEFSKTEKINISIVLDKVIKNFEELIQLKGLMLESSIADDVVLNNDQTLIRVLLNNLLQNAIRHNHQGGEMKIHLDQDQLMISNTGEDLDVPPEQLFDRFRKGAQSVKNTGLGLAIVKKICELSGYEVRYQNENHWHTLTIRFTNREPG